MKDGEPRRIPRRSNNRRRRRESGEWYEGALHAIEVSRVAKEERGFLAVRTGRALSQMQRKRGFEREGFKSFADWTHARCSFLGNQVGRYIKVSKALRPNQVKGRKLSFSAVEFISKQRRALWSVLLEYGSGHTEKSLTLAMASIADILDDERAVARLKHLLQQSAGHIEQQAPKQAQQKYLVAQCTRRLQRSLQSISDACDLGVYFFDNEFSMEKEKMKALLEKTVAAQAKMRELAARLSVRLDKSFAAAR